MPQDLVAHGRLGETGQGGGVFQTENTPKNTAHQQGDGRFIDSRFVFEGDEGIAYDKQDEHGCNHNYSIALNPFIYKRCFLHPEEPADNAVLLIENENFPSLFSAFGTIRAVSHPPVENGRKDCAPAGRTLDRQGSEHPLNPDFPQQENQIRVAGHTPFDRRQDI